MTHTQLASRAAAAAAALLLLLAASSHGVGTARAQGADGLGVRDQIGFTIVGTWLYSVPLGPGNDLIGFTTYDHSGTITSTVSNMFGGLPFTPAGRRLFSTDRGIWRRVPHGFETMSYRMAFDPATGDIVRIVRIRSLAQFVGDRDHMSATYFVTQWDCPTATTCPDPTSDAPTTAEFAPPGNTWTQSRVRFP